MNQLFDGQRGLEVRHQYCKLKKVHRYVTTQSRANQERRDLHNEAAANRRQEEREQSVPSRAVFRVFPIGTEADA